MNSQRDRGFPPQSDLFARFLPFKKSLTPLVLISPTTSQLLFFGFKESFPCAVGLFSKLNFFFLLLPLGMEVLCKMVFLSVHPVQFFLLPRSTGSFAFFTLLGIALFSHRYTSFDPFPPPVVKNHQNKTAVPGSDGFPPDGTTTVLANPYHRAPSLTDL